MKVPPPVVRLISCCVPKSSFKIVPSNNNIDKYKKDNNSNKDNCNNNENNDNSDNDADMSSSSGHSLSTDESGCGVRIKLLDQFSYLVLISMNYYGL